MKVFLIRHSLASNTYPDSKRELSKEGIILLENSIQVWKKFGIHFDEIYSSPLARTMQTAEIIKDRFMIRNSIIINNDLQPGSNLKDLISILNTSKFEFIAVVGHQPDLTYHLSDLISGNSINCAFSPATLAEIHFTNRARIGSGILEKFIPPIR